MTVDTDAPFEPALQETIGWHWDKDEYAVDAYQVNIHPHLSSVTYLR